MKFDLKKTIGVAVAIIVVIIIIVLIFNNQNPSGSNPTNPGNNIELTPTGPVTREAPPQNVVVPDTNSANVPENVAIPDVVAPGSSKNDSSYRSFDIEANHNEFSPNTVIGKEGDTINIFVTAVDKDYDFTQPDFGFKEVIKKGKTGKIQVTVPIGASGKFTFYCVSCGGPESGPVGYIVAAKK